MEIEQILVMLGLNLPRVLFVNVLSELSKNELEELDAWKPIRKVGFLIPIAIAIVICWISGEKSMGALKCGLMYAAAAVALHELHSRL